MKGSFPTPTPEERQVLQDVFQDSVLVEIEKIAETGTTLCDAIQHYIDGNGIEPDAIARQIKSSKEFRAKLTAEAKQLRLLRK